MQGLFRYDGEAQKTPARSWSTLTLGFIGGAIISWIALGAMAPLLASAWNIDWLNKFWTKVGITGILAASLAVLLSRIEGTIWGRYYVIIGYLFSLGLVIWIILRLLQYV